MRLIELDENNRVIRKWDNPPADLVFTERFKMAADNVDVHWTYVPAVQGWEPPPPPRLVTRRAFRKRFSPTERMNFEIAEAKLYRETPTEQEIQVGALIAVFQRDVSDGPYVDLELDEVEQGLLALDSFGLLDDVHDPENYVDRVREIIDAPVADNERYTG